jgi:hypothetical protein
MGTAADADGSQLVPEEDGEASEDPRGQQKGQNTASDRSRSSQSGRDNREPSATKFQEWSKMEDAGRTKQPGL